MCKQLLFAGKVSRLLPDEGFPLVDKKKFAKCPHLERNLLILYLVIRLKRGDFCFPAQDAVEYISVDEFDSPGELSAPGGRRLMKVRSLYEH